METKNKKFSSFFVTFLLKFVLIQCFVILSAFMSFSQTYIPAGSVSGVWHIGGSPYIVQGDIYIPNGQTLNIDAGVIVQFDCNTLTTPVTIYTFNIYGILNINGNSIYPVKISAINTFYGWKGLYFDNSASGSTSHLFYCMLEHAKENGIYVYNSSRVEIDHCSIRYCAGTSGAGIYLESSNPIISNSNIERNDAQSDGGGLYIDGNSFPDLDNNVFDSNTAQNGGGIYIENTNFNIDNEIITFNNAVNGGGIFTMQSGGTITSCTFENNDADNGGAVFCNSGSSPTFEDNSYLRNHANKGGGIYLESSGALINDVIKKNRAFYGGGIFIYGNSQPQFGAFAEVSENLARYGGGIYIKDGNSLTVINNIPILKNSAQFDGGGIYLDNSDAEISGTSIRQNIAENGAGIYLNDSSDAYIVDNVIEMNNASVNGGGIYSSYSDPQITTCNIDNNNAYDGGGIYFYYSDPYFHDIPSISFDSASNQGGGIYFYRSNGNIQDLTVSNNYALFGGGGIYIFEGDTKIFTSIVENNTSNEDGGGIYFLSTSYNGGIYYSDINNNVANLGDGGGINILDANPVVAQCDIIGNSANNGFGGGIHVYSGSTGYINVNNIENNSAVEGGGIYITQSTSWIHKNNIENNSASINGGGICAFDGIVLDTSGMGWFFLSPIIDSNVINNNQADSNGGGVYIFNYDVDFYGNVLWGDTADYDNNNLGNGGGVYFEWANKNTYPNGGFTPLKLNNIRANVAENGGGIYIDLDGDISATYAVLNNLIALNEAITDGGGTYLKDVMSPEVNSNTIADNTANSGNGGGIYSSGSITTPNYFNNNIIYGNSPNSANNQLSGLSNNYPSFNKCDIEGCTGNPNCFDLNPYFHGSGNYHLHYSPFLSPCIDAGDNSKTHTSLDLDHTNRIQYSIIDMGCYEHDRTNWLIFLSEDDENELISTNDENMEVYPNPFFDHLTVKMNPENDKDIQIVLYDATGKKVMESSSEINSENSNLYISVEHDLPCGIYLLMISDSNGDSEKFQLLKK